MTKRQSIAWIVASVVLTLTVLSVFVSDSLQEGITVFLQSHVVLGPLAVIAVRFVTIVLAPLPSSPVAFASLAVLPWWQALIYNIIGVQAGIVVAFFIARKFREPVVRHVASLRQVHAWQDRLTQRQQVAAFVALRFVSLAAYDVVSYAAGLSKLSFRTFFLGSLAVDLPMMLVFFYVGGKAYTYSIWITVFFVSLLAIGFFIFRRWQKQMI